MKLASYVLRMAALRIAAAAAVLLGVLQILDLIEVTPDLVERGLGFAGTLQYVALRLPRLIDQAAPLAVLAGGLFTFMKLAGDSEVTAIRAAGVSAYRLAALAMPVALAVAAIDVLAVEVVAPRTDRALAAWWQETAPDQETKSNVRAFRVGQEIVTAATEDLSGRTLEDVRIFRRDPDGRLTERIAADRAAWTGQDWRLDAAVFTRFTAQGANSGQAGQMTWRPGFEPADVQVLFSNAQTISAASAGRALMGDGAVRPPSYYATRLQRAFASPLAAVVMLLLTAPVALASFRSSQGAGFVAGSIAAGLMFLVVDGLAAALGESGAVSAVLAAWAAPAIFTALATTVLIRLEG